MSVILITHHDENIYNLKWKPQTVYRKSPRYVSKKRADNKNKNTKHYKSTAHGTMGLAEEIPPDPSKFLKKNTGKLAYTSKTASKDPAPNIPRKSPVPLLEECLKNYKRPETTKNFIADNIKTAVNMKPKEPIPRVVLGCQGESKPLTAGLEPVYIKSSALGKKPKYLRKFIKMNEKQYQKKKDREESMLQPKCRYVTREEREDLLKGLKENWEELQKQFQVLPMLTDTIPKINRKVQLESELKQLEKDIVMIETHPYIYVYDDNKIPGSEDEIEQ